MFNDVSKLTSRVKPSWHIVEAANVIASVVTDGPAMIKVEKSRRIWQISMKIWDEWCKNELHRNSF